MPWPTLATSLVYIQHIALSWQVALRLLDSDFPDEIVRSFATTILEPLGDDSLQDYLLQLTQVPPLVEPPNKGHFGTNDFVLC